MVIGVHMESVGDMSFIYLQRMSGAVFSVLIVAVSSTMQISATDSLNIQGNESEGSRVAAVEGGDTNLPCDTRSPDDLDILQLVVWYREDTPIYSYDGRVNGPSAHWVEEALEGRARWHAQAPSALHLSKVEPSDAAEYRCRVDFHVSPTRNCRIMLDVIELPGKPVIFDEYGKELTGMTGPYVEGGFFQLTCMVKGGKPAPRVRWWHEDSVLAVSTPVGDRADEPHSLQLRVQNLTRDHLHAAYTCTADNAPLVPPKRTTIEVELYLRPLSVEILSELPLSVGREAKISCRSTGARPPATLSWWLDDREQLSTIEKQQDSEEGNETLSVIRWTPQLEHNGRVMVCRANHRTLNHTYMQSVLPLKVYFAPIVNLQLGSKLNPNDIEEGDDVYFECSVTANPPAYKVVWEHNGMVMQHNQRAGVIAGSAHLALQGVTRRQAGRYSCTASNVEGDGRSPAVHLQVMYKPVCRSESVVVVGVALQEAVRVLCEVEAHPPPDTFQWTLNNSAGAFEVDSARYTLESAAGRSTLTYAPATETDYGALTCRASNLAGQQRTPCRYTLRPAAPPDAPKNCTTMNITNDSLELRCEPGYDGGLMAKFLAECWAGGMLLKNESGTVAVWHLHSLGESRAIRLVVYAANARGRSVPVTLHTRTLAKLSPQMEAQGGTQWDMTWAVGGVTGLIGTVLLVTCVGLLAGSRLRRHRSTEHNSGVVSMKSYKSSPPSRTSPMASDDKNPDVVPLNQGTQSCTLERPPEPPPYSAVASAPPSSRSSHSLQSHRTHAHNPHEHAPTTPHTPHSDVLSERGDKWRIAGLESCGSTARARREVVTTCTPLLATAHQESCV